jgi:hypothetical protein
MKPDVQIFGLMPESREKMPLERKDIREKS